MQYGLSSSHAREASTLHKKLLSLPEAVKPSANRFLAMASKYETTKKKANRRSSMPVSGQTWVLPTSLSVSTSLSTSGLEPLWRV